MQRYPLTLARRCVDPESGTSEHSPRKGQPKLGPLLGGMFLVSTMLMGGVWAMKKGAIELSHVEARRRLADNSEPSHEFRVEGKTSDGWIKLAGDGDKSTEAVKYKTGRELCEDAATAWQAGLLSSDGLFGIEPENLALDPRYLGPQACQEAGPDGLSGKCTCNLRRPMEYSGQYYTGTYGNGLSCTSCAPNKLKEGLTLEEAESQCMQMGADITESERCYGIVCEKEGDAPCSIVSRDGTWWDGDWPNGETFYQMDCRAPASEIPISWECSYYGGTSKVAHGGKTLHPDPDFTGEGEGKGIKEAVCSCVYNETPHKHDKQIDTDSGKLGVIYYREVTN